MPLQLFPPALVGYLLFLLGVLGACMGSFLTCAASRLTAGESFLKGRSHCDSCGHPLSLPDLFPILSWLLLRGKCRYCGQAISPRCPVMEGLTALVYLSLLWRYGLSFRFLGALVLCSALLLLSLVDLDTQLVPDGALLAGLAGFLLWSLGGEVSLQGYLTCLFHSAVVTLPLLLLVLLFERITGREAMGGGDIKLMALLGLFFSWQGNLFLLILACLLGLLLALLLGKWRPGTPFPFAPALSAAGWCALLFGEALVQWYLNLFL